MVPSPSKVIRLPSAEQAASLDKLESFPTPTKSNGKDAEKTPEYVWKAPYEPGSAWADQEVQICLNEERKAKRALPSIDVRRKAVVDDAAVRGERIAEEIDGSKPGKTEKVITKATSPSRIPDVKKVPALKAVSTVRRPENRRP